MHNLHLEAAVAIDQASINKEAREMASKSSRSKANFAKEHMGNKLVDEVPGIGDETGKSLKKEGITKAKQLYGHYLINPDQFKDFIKSHGGDRGIQKKAFEAMKEWDDLNN